MHIKVPTNFVPSDIINIKDVVKNNYVKFREYRKGVLYYQVVVMNNISIENAGLYVFPVPIEDCGDATFKSSDKAIMFMRYIRKSLEDGTFAKV